MDDEKLTVNTEQYIELMARKFIPTLKGTRGVDMDTVIYRQDGATSPLLQCFIMNSLETGSSSIIRTTLGLYILQTYPFLDYFLWGYLKDRFYAPNY